MKFSIFTPTNDTRYLIDLWQSLKDQKGNFEWVLLLNGGAELPFEFPKDSRIKVFTTTETRNIGKLKRRACEMCSGDVLVEVDHDDLLSPEALSSLEIAFQDREIGFVYSDFVEFVDGTWESSTYSSDWGWKTYETEVLGKNLTAIVSPGDHPRNISEIYFAPNHVRAWRKEIYDKIGGHNETLEAGDDHELVCRTYLATQFKRIPKCLYLYRRREEAKNSYLKKFDLIQIQSLANRDRYFQQLAERWANLHNLPMIDLGGGHGKPEGYKSVDLVNGDIKHDVRKGLPFKDSTVGIIRAVDFLEHIQDKIKLINEIYRVLVPGGILLSITPSTDGRGAFQDPTHASFYNENSFFYYTNRMYNQYTPEAAVRFQAARLFTSFPTSEHKRLKVAYVFADLVSLKDGFRPMGLIEI